MSNLKQFESKQDQVVSEEALAPMRTLTAEELSEVVGGPDINNGGGGISVTTNVVSSTGS
ncbi:MAG TPA: hypothetical protein VES00_12730 [Burkholderiaceae bacterium]|jgi:hypothetical protein|nr:hypothetical protein [Burkholderiaceae bacterium]